MERTDKKGEVRKLKRGGACILTSKRTKVSEGRRCFAGPPNKKGISKKTNDIKEKKNEAPLFLNIDPKKYECVKRKQKKEKSPICRSAWVVWIDLGWAAHLCITKKRNINPGKKKSLPVLMLVGTNSTE